MSNANDNMRHRFLKVGMCIIVADSLLAFVGVGVLGPLVELQFAIDAVASVGGTCFLIAGTSNFRSVVTWFLIVSKRRSRHDGLLRGAGRTLLAIAVVAYGSCFVIAPAIILAICLYWALHTGFQAF